MSTDFSHLAGASACPADDGCGVGGHASKAEKAAVGKSGSGGKAVNLLDDIRRLKEEQKALKDQKKVLTKTLKNALRRRTRLQKKAKMLSEQDILDVWRMRNEKPLADCASLPAPKGAASSVPE